MNDEYNYLKLNYINSCKCDICTNCNKYEKDSDNEDNTEYSPIKNSENVPIVEFLKRCRQSTYNLYKQEAYDRAIWEVSNRSDTLKKPDWKLGEEHPFKFVNIGPSIHRKISEFLDGICEEDIIRS